MAKAFILKYYVPDKIFEGVLSDQDMKSKLEKKMETECLGILFKEYSRLSPDLRRYLEMRYPDDGGQPGETQTARDKRQKGVQQQTNVSETHSQELAGNVLYTDIREPDTDTNSTELPQQPIMANF